MLESLNTGKFEYKRLSLEEQKSRGILGRLAGIIADTTEATRNGRKYSSELWENVFENPVMKEKIANHCLFGELGHPTDREEVDMEKVAICLAEQPKKGEDGKLYGVFDILSTPNGKILKSLCDYGCNIGVSSRGTGDLITDDDGNEAVDPETYNCECWDAVLVPAVESARLKYVTESLDTKKRNKTLRQKLSEDLEKASEEDRKIMEETLSDLDINLEDELEEKVDADLQGIKPKKAGKFETSLPKGSVKRINDIVSEMDEEDFELLNDNAWDAYLDKNEEALAIVKPILRKYHLPMWALMAFVEAWDEFDEALDQYKIESGTLRGELTRLVRALKEEIPEADKDDFNREFKTALKNVFGDLEEELDLSNEDDFGIHDELVHKLYNAIKVAIKDFIQSGHSSIADLDDSDIERAAEEAIMRLTDGINEECNNESCADKEEEKEEVVNDESEIVAQLQESLIQNKKLADDNLSLQEKLSVCNAKEVKLEEELKQKTNAVINLSDKAKEVKPLTEKVNKLTETLARKDDVIKANRSRLEIMVEKKKELYKQLDESLSDNTNLQSQVDNLNDQLESLNSKLNESKETIKKYQKAYASLKESYLDSKADAYGIKKEAVKANLKESYSVKDIDLVCESLANEKKAMSKLPFRINEGASIKASQSKDYSIKMKDKRSSNDDDFVSDSLLRMIK